MAKTKTIVLERDGDELHILDLNPWFYRRVMRRDPEAIRLARQAIREVIPEDSTIIVKIVPDNRSVLRLVLRLGFVPADVPNPAYVTFGARYWTVMEQVGAPRIDRRFEQMVLLVSRLLAGVDKHSRYNLSSKSGGESWN